MIAIASLPEDKVDELRQLNVFERFEGRFPKGAKGYSIPTFEAVLQLIEELNSLRLS